MRVPQGLRLQWAGLRILEYLPGPPERQLGVGVAGTQHVGKVGAEGQPGAAFVTRSSSRGGAAPTWGGASPYTLRRLESSGSDL